MLSFPLSLAVFLPIIAVLLLTQSCNNRETLPSEVAFFCPQTENLSVARQKSASSSLHGALLSHCASWRLWFHPHRAISGPRKGSSSNWNVLYHLGGNGPWIEMDGEEKTGIEMPETCMVDQVHMMSRHSERYPTESVGKRHLAFLDRVQKANVLLNGSLAFLNNWTYFTSHPEKDFEQLTASGPYAGTLEAFSTGVRYRTRYEHLLPKNTRMRLWASDSKRVSETAQYFATGLFGLDWQSKGHADLEIIPETFDRGADTLTPGDTCLRYLEDVAHGHDNGINMLQLFQDVYIPAIAKRLISEEGNDAIGNLTNLEVYGMQEMCGFETMTRGSSPWCDAFTEEDWNHFEYARDLIHYYRAGPGNPYAGAMGWLWLNATASILQSGPRSGTMFFSFVHDGDIAPFLTALDIFNDPKYDPHLPVGQVATDRIWRTSSVLPMGARITLERMTCSPSTTTDANMNEVFVRVNINDRIVQLPYCNSGPGRSCSLGEFMDFVRRRRVEVGDFADVCGLQEPVGYISFLKQH